MRDDMAMMDEARRVGWPTVFQSDLGLDVLQIGTDPDTYRSGFGWLLTETGTHLVPPAPGARAVIEDLAGAYPEGCWYFVRDGVVAAITSEALVAALEATRFGAAA
ncbi:MAG: hypothetical protein U0166_02655 [Acidobacteriota bacterium]